MEKKAESEIFLISTTSKMLKKRIKHGKTFNNSDKPNTEKKELEDAIDNPHDSAFRRAFGKKKLARSFFPSSSKKNLKHQEYQSNHRILNYLFNHDPHVNYIYCCKIREDILVFLLIVKPYRRP